MNEMKLFENPEFGAIRTVEVGGEPWLVGKDVAQALGYSDTSDALKRHVDPEDIWNCCKGHWPRRSRPRGCIWPVWPWHRGRIWGCCWRSTRTRPTMWR